MSEQRDSTLGRHLNNWDTSDASGFWSANAGIALGQETPDAASPLIAPAVLLMPDIRAASGADVAASTPAISRIISADPPPDDASDAAVNGAAARQTYGVTGAGLTIGIISDSFNSLGGYQSDLNQGFLSPVTVLGDTTGSDEGRAMAELVHETAPGAHIDFDDAGQSTSSFAAAVTALRNAGCKIIVDDITFPSGEPFFQLGGSLDTAIESFVAAGGDYFSAAGNDGNDYYQTSFTPVATTLPGLGAVTAENFGTAEAAISGNAALQSLTIAPGGSIDLTLEWDQPFPGIGGSAGAANNLGVYLYQNGSIVASAATPQGDGTPAQELTFTNPASATSSNFQLAVVWNSGTIQPGLFRYFLNNAIGTINDPAASQGQGDLYGHELLPDINVVGAAGVATAPPQANGPPAAETFSEYGPGEILFDGSGNRLASPRTEGGISFVGPDGSNTTNGFNPFFGTSSAAPVAAAIAALVLQKNSNLTPAQVTSILKQSAIPLTGAATQLGAGFIQANTALADTPCYARGTRIRTARGEVAIESLRAGDAAITASGAERPILWIGHRALDLTRHPDPARVWPVRIRAGAFADGLPCRDLIVSPDHALFVDGALIMARLLINGVSIVREKWQSIEYFHVQLDRHDVLLAEALPAESFLDTGHRVVFDGDAIVSHRAFAGGRCPRACAPSLTRPEDVRPVWLRLAARADRGSGTKRAA